jgi:hypothetical protein
VPLPEYDQQTAERMAAQGEGFYAPEPPQPHAVLSMMSLYCREREEWDEAPELGVLLSAYGNHVSSYPLPIPEPTWDAYDRPARVITRLRDVLWKQGRTDHALLRDIDRPTLTDMVGVYFRYEAWGPPKGKEQQAIATVRSGIPLDLAKQEGRRELRNIVAVTVDGSLYLLSQVRDDPERFRTMHLDFDGKMSGNLPYVHEMTGNLPVLMRELCFGLIKHMRPGHANLPKKKS